jgi:hypothetical protein
VRIQGATKAWAWGTSLALILTVGSEKARGQGIIYTAPQQPTYYSVFYPGTLDFAIDINGDGTTDFILRSNDSGSSINNAFLIPQGNNAIVIHKSYVADMNNGETVGSSLDPVYQWSNTKVPISAVALLLDPTPVEEGNFVGQLSGYMGFDIVNNGMNYYGWMYISSPSGDGLNGDAAIYGEIVDWAYQSSPNTPIEVGAVPEPSTWGLLMLGAILFFVKRKRPSFSKAARLCWNSGN